jgi:hypothetical protein
MKKYPVIEVSPEDEEEEIFKQDIEDLTTEGEADKTSYDVSKFIKMANNNEQYLDKFIQSTLKALVEYEQDFQKAVRTKSSKMLGDLIHKSTMSLFYIQADKLTDLLNKLQFSMEQGTLEEDEIVKKAAECSLEFNNIIEGLKRIDAGELVK